MAGKIDRVETLACWGFSMLLFALAAGLALAHLADIAAAINRVAAAVEGMP